jgi:hypothetical protein
MKFELQTFKDSHFKLSQSRCIKLFDNTNTSLFIILYNHYLPKNSELKNQVPKLRFKI